MRACAEIEAGAALAAFSIFCAGVIIIVPGLPCWPPACVDTGVVEMAIPAIATSEVTPTNVPRRMRMVTFLLRELRGHHDRGYRKSRPCRRSSKSGLRV
jgi:hypothetical protein